MGSTTSTSLNHHLSPTEITTNTTNNKSHGLKTRNIAAYIDSSVRNRAHDTNIPNSSIPPDAMATSSGSSSPLSSISSPLSSVASRSPSPPRDYPSPPSSHESEKGSKSKSRKAPHSSDCDDSSPPPKRQRITKTKELKTEYLDLLTLYDSDEDEVHKKHDKKMRKLLDVLRPH